MKPSDEEEMAALRQRIHSLEEENKALKSDILFLKKIQDYSLLGEYLVACVVEGIRRENNESHDVDAPNGQRLEVKTSKLTREGGWKWGKVFGEGSRGKKKEYDYLVLLGEKNAKWARLYRCTNLSFQFVMFCVPRAEVDVFVSGIGTENSSRFRSVSLNSNPIKGTEKARPIFVNYQVTPEELKRQFQGVPNAI